MSNYVQTGLAVEAIFRLLLADFIPNPIFNTHLIPNESSLSPTGFLYMFDICTSFLFIHHNRDAVHVHLTQKTFFGFEFGSDENQFNPSHMNRTAFPNF